MEKELNEQKKAITPEIIDFMSKHSIEDCNTNNGKLKYSKFAINPITYITTVGLYDKNNELVAVGKLSKPIKKTMENEVLIDVRLSI